MARVIIFPIEPIETRYTGEWYRNIPNQLIKAGADEVIQIDGEVDSADTTEGAFLNFSATNVYKSTQLVRFVRDVLPTLKNDDRILFTDAWNPCAIQVRYMLDLMGIEARMIGMWHAGSYDRFDFLGRGVSPDWSYQFERSLYHAYDLNVFATEFHFRMFQNVLNDGQRGKIPVRKTVIAGWPMEYLQGIGDPSVPKENIVLFPHRLSEEKNPQVFDALAERLGHKYQFIKCQDQKLTKDQYHALLRRAKVVFSASEQETLGIGVYEGLLCGAAPYMPDHLSYSEIWSDHPKLLYFKKHVLGTEGDLDILANEIEVLMDNDEYRENIVKEALHNEYVHSFFDGHNLYQAILR